MAGDDNVKVESLLREVTPSRMRCTIGKCPAIFTLEENRLVIIGKKASAEILNEIAHRLGDDEFCVVIDRMLIEDA